MSRDFELSTADYLELASDITGAPSEWSFAAWVKLESTGITQTIMSIAINASGNHFLKLDVSTSGNLRFRARSTAGPSDAIAAGMTSGSWIFVGCRKRSGSSDRSCFLGTTKGDNTTSRAATGMNRTSIGRTADTNGPAYFDGLIAYPTWWNVALTDAEFATLAGGGWPGDTQTANVIDILRLTGSSPEVGDNSTSFTLSGSPTYSADEPFAAPGGSHTCALPLSAVSLGAYAVTAETTDNHTATLPLATIALGSYAVTAATTDVHTSALPLSTIALQGYAVTAATTDAHTSVLPLATLSLDPYAVNGITTDKNVSALPLSTISLNSFPVTAVTTASAGSHTSTLPLATLTLQNYAVLSVVTDNATTAPVRGGFPVTWHRKDERKKRKTPKRRVEIVHARKGQSYSEDAVKALAKAVEDAALVEGAAAALARGQMRLNLLKADLIEREIQKAAALLLAEEEFRRAEEARELDLLIIQLAAEELKAETKARQERDLFAIIQIMELVDIIEIIEAHP